MRFAGLFLLLLASCADHPAPARTPAPLPPAPAPPPVAPAPPPVPPIVALRETWSDTCTLTGKAPKACDLQAAAVANDGMLVVGGGSYDAFSLGGANHPKRSYEQLLLVAYDAAGKPLWSHAWGTQWHNLVDDALFIGSRIVITGTHANGFDAGGKRIPDRPYNHVAGQDTAFEAETSFVASLDRDGKVQWARNVADLVGLPATTAVSTGIGYGNPKIFPDRQDGFWLAFTAADPALQIVHVSGEQVVARRSVLLPKLDPVPGRSAWIDEDGNLMLVGIPAWVAGNTTRSAFLYRFDTAGQGRATPLASWPVSTGPQDNRRLPFTQLGVALRPDGTGGAYVAIMVQALQDSIKTASIRYQHVNDSGVLVVDRPVMAPVSWQATGPDAFSLRGMTVPDDGWPRIVLHQRVVLQLDGVSLAPTSFGASYGVPSGTLTVVSLAPDGSAMNSVATLAPAPCVKLRPDSVRAVFAAGSATFLLGGASKLPGCWDGRPADGAVSRIEP